MAEEQQTKPKAAKEAVPPMQQPPASAAMPQQAAEEAQKKRAPAKRKVSKKGKVTVVRSKRKSSVARAYVKAGKGVLRINGTDIDALEFRMAKEIITEPLMISAFAKDQARKLDIKINVQGGGISSQIQAARGALARGIVEFTGSDTLKREFMNYDRALMVDDTRRVESKKFLGTKARARFQTSYR